MGLAIIRRELQAESLGDALHPVLDRVYRGRNVASVDELDTRVNALCHYESLKGIGQAAAILHTAIAEQQRVVIVGDFDADGATSTAVCMLGLRQMGLQNIAYLVPNRFDFGYGLSPEIVDVACDDGAQVILTVDNGIACLDGVNRAKARGATVVVTDHHLPGAELPQADAIVNPNQPDCGFMSKHLAGVGVAFYLMLAVRARLQQQKWFEQQGITPPNLAELLDIVAVGTVADVVVLDKNNRILVHQGLQRIRAGRCRPGIRALLEVAGRQPGNIGASDLGFVVGPRLNAAGRLDDMALGIECLLCEDAMQARYMATELDRLNQQRRTIESEMKEEAEAAIAAVSVNASSLPAGLVVYQKDFHQGVIGIVAGRIKDKYKRPTIAFAHQDEDTIKGSARSVNGVHIRDVLEEVNIRQPGLIPKFGGHAMAAGLSLPLTSLTVFQQTFDEVVATHLARVGDSHHIVTDGALNVDEVSLSVARLLKQAVPFGQGFEAPAFDGVFEIANQRLLKEKHLKLALKLDSGEEVDAIAFNVDTSVWPNYQTRLVQLVYQLEVNAFRGQETVQLMVQEIAPYEN
ncbi:single-stranded-DNA-specific exonuclease RecJ [Salinimonas sp. HHU 13199]|uniref:Single-stranded-DNA-specific exonuclease RecJ n=1 Tax=Salinimonas profundi TaxID=2729140 RepID=A0ABR8LI26_9ALTE|nr:single-stranded-DNA-specific exonuclease RecJ [Salinimonas profundi]MBD3585888.1 single-stranded-DNA-specific exonuclease RecJ [Salinimonas profundi]